MNLKHSRRMNINTNEDKVKFLSVTLNDIHKQDSKRHK